MTKTLTKPEAAVAVPVDLNPRQLCAMAVQNGAGIEVLERLTALAERWDAEEAKKAYGAALTKFQALCPIIPKSKTADRYSYAGYDDIWARIKPLLGDVGLAVGFSAPPHPEKDRYQTVVRLRVGAYAEDSHFVAPWPNLAEVAKRQGISEPQAMGTIISYYKRYALCNALGIVTGDEDLDGKFTTDLITPEQAEEIDRLLDETGVSRAKFLTWLDVTKVEDILTRNYAKAVNHLNEKKGGAR